MFQKRALPLTIAIIAASGAMSTATHAQDDALLEEIVVQGVRAAEMNAREMEREKNIFSSVISQDDAGNFADQNVAEALQRLPGVTLQKSDGQGEFVNIRGMGAGFVGVSLNNSEMASASGDGRAVGLNTIPADLMGSIEVFKSLTPDMDLNSIAGRVNVNSVTAFTRGEDSLRLSIQGAMHDQRGEFSPKATLIGTKLFADETIGLAVSVSHEERATEVNQISNESGLQWIRPARPGIGTRAEYQGNEFSSRDYADNYFDNLQGESELGADPWLTVPRMLTPNNFQIRQDESVRTTSAATLDLGWRPTLNSEYYFRLSRTEHNDEELTSRETYNFGASDARYVAYTNTEFEPTQSWIDTYGFDRNNLFAVGYADLHHEVFVEEHKDTNMTFTIGGEQVFDDRWTLDFEFHHSNSERVTPDDRRVRFRNRRLAMAGQLGMEDINAAVIPAQGLAFLADQAGTPRPDGGIPGTGGMSGSVPYIGGSRVQPHMTYDNLYLNSGSREDELSQMELNLQRDFFEGPLSYIKAGVLFKERERDRDRVTVSINPSDFGGRYCTGEGISEQDALLCRLWNRSTQQGAVPDPQYEQQLRDQYGDDWDSSILQFTTYTPRNPRFDHDFITVDDAERLIARTRVIPTNLGLDRLGAASRADDYSLFEDSQEAYLMAEFQIGDNASLITGARYVNTDVGSTGYLTLQHNRFQNEEGFPRDIIMPLTDPDGDRFVTNSYSGVYPGAHLRWDFTDQILIRGAIWQSYTRPSFGQAAPRANFSSQVQLCRDEPLNVGTDNERDRCSNNLVGDLGITENANPETDNAFYYQIAQDLSLAPGGNSLRLGNTDLTAMEATNFDASISFYGDGGRFLEAAVFYKDISDYVVDIRGASIERGDLPANVQQALDRIDSTGVSLEDLREQELQRREQGSTDFSRNVFQIDENFVFHDVSTSINGDKAYVYGAELSYSEFFDNGLFLNTNLTLLNSSADAGEAVRADRTRMPYQSDVTVNLTLGWENDFMSTRLIGNYRSKILTQIGTCSQADIDRDETWARINDAGYDGEDAIEGRAGDGTVYQEYCQRWADVFHDDIFSLDFKATYNLTSNIRFYLDVMNITEDVDVFYYRGTEQSTGPVLQFSESLGRTYQAGVNIRFW
ncbi:TonB-dependent receptor [Marinimicrobium alkaliphilum]|uniref:TonB-dependent receptor n=1 Tax=Marinimicrobium alkaliphilum TaxID=2202654 RepID=UPI000DB92381|nr:TonB-dependent receptor [Marinimicrobium alkaliphilum]